MKTVSTKLDKRNHERLVDLCNEEGCTISEALRDMVEQWCNANEDGIEMEKETPKPIVTVIKNDTKLRTFDCSNGFLYENGVLIGNCLDYALGHGEVYDKNGNHLGTIKN